MLLSHILQTGKIKELRGRKERGILVTQVKFQGLGDLPASPGCPKIVCEQ